MNILELDSYNLADTVKFHDRLNPRLWDSSEHLRPEVKAKLMEVAQDFQEFLGVPDLDVKDITISGSNAAFNYTPQSDIDLHIVVDIPDVKHDEVYRELFNAKKYQYNDEHDIRIRGADVELYAQDSKQPHHSQGIYSLLRNSWISVPKRSQAKVDDVSARSKFEDLAARIDDTIKTHNMSRMDSLMKKIKTMRQTGLEQQGEFGSDNIAFKLLRNNGYIKRLQDARKAARDLELSLAELHKPKQPVVYGFVSESPDGVDPTTKMFLEEPANESPDGVNPTTAMFLTEVNTESVVQDFIRDTAQRLGIKSMPKIEIHHDEDWSEQNHSFGMYVPERHELHVSLSNRHLLDVLRTTAHELCHCAQHEQESLPDHAGATGSDWENEAHAVAGIIMRDFADAHPHYFQQDAIKESASGYIPKNKREARDPRYSMAITVDIKPGQVGKEANKLALNTGRNGEPTLLMKTANLQESLAAEFEAFSEGKSYGYGSTPLSQVPGEREDELGNQEATGPEFPPEMPAGTTKIDVSDLTDWYRLGMDISDLDDAKPENYNQGPPQTVVVFPSDEAEQGYLKQFKRLGLKTHDMDPDVKGGEDVTGKHLHKKLAEEFELFEQQDLFEINMGSKSLRQEAAKTGAIAGMEFEMIVPNVEDTDDQEQEPDYDYDQRCRSIDDVYQFFYDGEWNDRRSVEHVRDRMREDYMEWVDEKISEEWAEQGEDYITEWVSNNVDESEWNPDDLADDARSEALIEFAANVLADPASRYHQDAYDEFRDENQENWDESDWLDAEDLDTMSSVENAYSLNWPYWNMVGNGGEASIEDVANDFEDAIGRNVRASGNYHSGGVSRPSPSSQHYVVEPDGSLEGDNPGDVGLEFVSPPLPIDVIINDLSKVKRWAKAYGCYTNDSTGLHINVSVPNYSRDNLDFVKLALLLGDEYVLDLFGRSGNTYAKSAMKMVRDRVRERPDEAEQLLNKMKSNLDGLASKAIHSGVTSKYTSINTKDGHIEFRSPGGDWLDENFDKIENTLLRFTVAMSAALNPEMYREEYLKKLYKLLTQDQKGDDTIKYFSEYVAGKIPKAALRSFVKQAQLERKLKQGDTEGKKYWWRVGRPGFGATAEVVAASKEEAIEKGKAEYPDWANARDMTAKPLRPYEEPVAKPKYEIYNKQTGNTVEEVPANITDDTSAIIHLHDYQEQGPHGLTARQARDMFGVRLVGQNRSTANGREYQIFNPATEQVAVAFLAPNDEAALARLEQYRQSHPDDALIVRTPNGVEIVGLDIPMAQGRAATSPTGQWKIIDGLGREVYRFRPAVNTRAKANELAAIWAREFNFDGNYQVEPAEDTSQTDAENRMGLPDQTGDANWEIFDRRTGRRVFVMIANTEYDARRKYADWLSASNIPIETDDYGFRELARPGSTTDLAQQRATPGTFTGAWKIVDANGNELYRFSGIGNNQSDANRVATQWMQNNGYNYGTEIEVLPIMS